MTFDLTSGTYVTPVPQSSALEFVATNPEVVQSELFLELGPALQAEVEDTAVWAPPRSVLESLLAIFGASGTPATCSDHGCH